MTHENAERKPLCEQPTRMFAGLQKGRTFGYNLSDTEKDGVICPSVRAFHTLRECLPLSR